MENGEWRVGDDVTDGPSYPDHEIGGQRPSVSHAADAIGAEEFGDFGHLSVNPLC
jgi:hypothetical protein